MLRLFRKPTPSDPITKPPASWLVTAKQSTRYTPDMQKLSEYAYQLMFIYGDEQRNYPKHHLLGKGEGEDHLFMANGFTVNKFVIFNHVLPSEYPIALPTGIFATTPNGHIKGELVALRPYKFRDLDYHYSNGISFQRLRVKVNIPYKIVYKDKQPNNLREYIDISLGIQHNATHISDLEIATVRAWMYVGIPSYWKDVIDVGYSYKLCTLFKAKDINIGNYFYFRKQTNKGTQL